MRALVDKCRADNLPFVIAVDSNAHSVLWGEVTNTRGEVLEDYIGSNSLVVENVGCSPTFIARGTSSCIDITLSGCGGVVRGWEVSPVTSLSDHLLIKFNLNSPRDPVIPKPNLKKADWLKFRSLTELPLAPVPESVSAAWVDAEAEEINMLLQASIRRSCPLIRVRKGSSKQPGWSSEIQALKSNLRNLHRDYKRAPSDDSWRRYVEARRAFKKSLTKSRQNEWKAFVAETKGPKASARLFKCVQAREQAQIEIFSSRSGSPNETVAALMDSHFPGCDQISSLPPAHFHCTPFDVNDPGLSFISVERLRWCLATFKPLTSPGPDGIRPIILRQCGPLLLARLIVLFKAMLTSSYTPKCYRTSSVTFIQKPGKADYSQPRSCLLYTSPSPRDRG